MAWKLFLLNSSAELFSLVMLLGAIIFSYKLMIHDKGPNWDFISMAIAFLGVSIGFSIINGGTKINIFIILEHLTMMLSGLMFVSILLIAKKQKDGLK